MTTALETLMSEIANSVIERMDIEHLVKVAVNEALKDRSVEAKLQTLTIKKAQNVFGISRKSVVDIIQKCGVETTKEKCHLKDKKGREVSESQTFAYEDFAAAFKKARKMGVKIQPSRKRRAKNPA